MPKTLGFNFSDAKALSGLGSGIPASEFWHRNSGIGVPAKLPAYSSHFQKHSKQLAMFKRKLIKNCLQENLSAVDASDAGIPASEFRHRNSGIGIPALEFRQSFLFFSSLQLTLSEAFKTVGNVQKEID